MKQPLCIARELVQRAHPHLQPNWASSNTIDSESILLPILSCTSIQPNSPSQLVLFGQLINHQYYSPKTATIKQTLDDFPSHLITLSSIRHPTLCLPQNISTNIQKIKCCKFSTCCKPLRSWMVGHFVKHWLSSSCTFVLLTAHPWAAVTEMCLYLRAAHRNCLIM